MDEEQRLGSKWIALIVRFLRRNRVQYLDLTNGGEPCERNEQVVGLAGRSFKIFLETTRGTSLYKHFMSIN